VICLAGRPERQPDLKKPADSARRSRGLGRESGDRIKGCDGTWIHALGSLAKSRWLEHNQCRSLSYLRAAHILGGSTSFWHIVF
jgi:hypothetical protein